MWPGTPGGQERLLDNFLSLAHVAQHPKRQPERLSVVGVIERFERAQAGSSLLSRNLDGHRQFQIGAHARSFAPR